MCGKLFCYLKIVFWESIFSFLPRHSLPIQLESPPKVDVGILKNDQTNKNLTGQRHWDRTGIL